MTLANHSQHPMELVYREYGGGRIVDGRRQRPKRDVDGYTKCKRRVLLHGALGPKRYRRTQRVLDIRGGAAMEIEQRLVHGDKIAHLGHEFDDTIRSLGHSHEQLEINRQNNSRCPFVLNEVVRWGEFAALAFGRVGTETRIRIYAFDNGEPFVAYVCQDTDRA